MPLGEKWVHFQCGHHLVHLSRAHSFGVERWNIREWCGGDADLVPHQLCSAWLDRWHSMVPAISGPETASWTLQTGCHVPNPRVKGVGDACNREMGETFTGIGLSEVTPHCLWSQVDTCKEDQTSFCVPMRPTQELSNETQPSILLQECSTHFYMGEGDPYPQYHFWTFHACHACNGHSLLLFAISHACYLLMVLPCLSTLYCLSMFIVFDVLLACFSFAYLFCSHVICENSKLLMFTQLLLIMGSHTSKCKPITFVFCVTIVIELSSVTWCVPISC